MFHALTTVALLLPSPVYSIVRYLGLGPLKNISLAFSGKQYHLEKTLKIIVCSCHLKIQALIYGLNSAASIWYLISLEIPTLIFHEQ